jgi:hypothetical protein
MATMFEPVIAVLKKKRERLDQLIDILVIMSKNGDDGEQPSTGRLLRELNGNGNGRHKQPRPGRKPKKRGRGKGRLTDALGNEEAAALLGLQPTTLAGYRMKGKGPKWAKDGRRIVYTRGDVLAYKATQGLEADVEEDDEEHEAAAD